MNSSPVHNKEYTVSETEMVSLYESTSNTDSVETLTQKTSVNFIQLQERWVVIRSDRQQSDQSASNTTIRSQQKYALLSVPQKEKKGLHGTYVIYGRVPDNTRDPGVTTVSTVVRRYHKRSCTVIEETHQSPLLLRPKNQLETISL